MKRTFVLLSGLALLATACQHDSSRDDAMANCEAEATKAMEAAAPQPDQRTTWREQYVKGCMAKAGFPE